MLTKRTLLLSAGLLIGPLARGQAAAPAATGPDLLFWLLGGILGLVLLLVLVTSASLVSATHRRGQRFPAPVATPSSPQLQEGVTSC